MALLWNAPVQPVLRIRSKQSNRKLIADAVNTWLEMANVGVTITLGHNASALSFTGGLFGAIGLRLAAALGGSAGFAFCSGCSEVYETKRAPAPGRRHFCPNCGRTAAVRQAQARFRRTPKGREKARKRRLIRRQVARPSGQSPR